VQFEYSSDGGTSWNLAGTLEIADTAQTLFSYTFTSPLPVGTYRAHAIAKDKAGNSSPPSAPLSFTVSNPANVTFSAGGQSNTFPAGNQSTIVNHPFSSLQATVMQPFIPLQVKVTDINNNPINEVGVIFQIKTGTNGATATASSGQASFTNSQGSFIYAMTG